ncbi:MAG: acyl-CoA thioester hydrolase [Phenylobacterium sp.]|jgi:acyl-CoA thioester hydrolase
MTTKATTPTFKTSSTIIEVPFFDVDAMNIVWHGHYVKYLEVARCDLLRLFDYDYLQMKESGYLWPIVDMRIKYVGSAKFSHHIEVFTELVEIENRIKINYRIKDVASGEVLTKAHTVQVAVDVTTGEMQFESPAILYEKLGLSK